MNNLESDQIYHAGRLRVAASDVLDVVGLPTIDCHDARELRRIAEAVAKAAEMIHAAEQIEARWRDTNMQEA